MSSPTFSIFELIQAIDYAYKAALEDVLSLSESEIRDLGSAFTIECTRGPYRQLVEGRMGMRAGDEGLQGRGQGYRIEIGDVIELLRAENIRTWLLCVYH